MVSDCWREEAEPRERERYVDALGHVNVVARGPPAAVSAGLGLDGDGLGRADGLAELAGNATLLACASRDTQGAQLR